MVAADPSLNVIHLKGIREEIVQKYGSTIRLVSFEVKSDRGRGKNGDIPHTSGYLQNKNRNYI